MYAEVGRDPSFEPVEAKAQTNLRTLRLFVQAFETEAKGAQGVKFLFTPRGQ